MARLEGAYTVTATRRRCARRLPRRARLSPAHPRAIGEDGSSPPSHALSTSSLRTSCVTSGRGARLDRREGLHNAQGLPAGKNALCIFGTSTCAAGLAARRRRGAGCSRADVGDAQRASAGRGGPRHRVPDPALPPRSGSRRRRESPSTMRSSRTATGSRAPSSSRISRCASRDPDNFNPLTRRREAHRRRRRHDLAREHHRQLRRHAPRSGGFRSARPHLVTPGRLAVLLRHRLPRRGTSFRCPPLGRGDAPLIARHRCTTSRSTACRRRRCSRGLGLPRMLHARLPDARAAEAREAPLRDCAA